MTRLLPLVASSTVGALVLVAAVAGARRDGAAPPSGRVAAGAPVSPAPLPGAGSASAAASGPADGLLPRPIPVDAPAPGQAQPGGPIPVAGAAAAGGSLGPWGPPAAPGLDPRRFTEAHWQGLETIPKTPALAEALGLPADVPGVIVDDVTLPADLQGFEAGDLVVAVGSTPTPDLPSLMRAADAVRDQRQAPIALLRDGARQTLVLTALGDRLGTANGETPPMILPGARTPHAYRGPCVECHRIGSTGALAVDQGDLLTKAAPVIRAGATAPHRARGPCSTCHRIVP